MPNVCKTCVPLPGLRRVETRGAGGEVAVRYERLPPTFPLRLIVLMLALTALVGFTAGVNLAAMA